MSSLSWPAVVGTAINLNVATLGAIGTGDYTLVGLTKPGATSGHAVVGLQVSSSFSLQIIVDTGVWYGVGDFSGFGTATTDWQIIGQSKASGSNVYRWHYYNYTLGGSTTHADGTGTHANPGTITAIQIGNGDNRGNGLIAFVAMWKRVLSDAEFDGACTSNLSSWFALSPDAILACNVAAASVVDGTGNGNGAASVTGTISLTGADPPGYNYALSSTVTGTGSAALGGLAATAAGTRVVSGTGAGPLGGLVAAATTGGRLVGNAHGPLPLAGGEIAVHTVSIAGAVT